MDQHGFFTTDNRCMYSSAYPYSRLCGGLSGLLESGGKGNLFSGIYGELDSGGGGGVREQGFDEHILRSWGERQFSFREQGTKPPSPNPIGSS